ncbi:hypothetical protein F5887DRAFT_921026, partial [Amanita rubescens]
DRQYEGCLNRQSSFGLNHDIRWFTMSPPPMLDAQKAAGVIPGEDRLGDRGVKTSRSSLMLDSLRESACERMAGERANGMRAIEGIDAQLSISPPLRLQWAVRSSLLRPRHRLNSANDVEGKPPVLMASMAIPVMQRSPAHLSSRSRMMGHV